MSLASRGLPNEAIEMTRSTLSEFGIGARVVVREGGCLERQRWLKRNTVGEVVAFQADLPAYGDSVIVRWPGEELSPAFMSVAEFDIA